MKHLLQIAAIASLLGTAAMAQTADFSGGYAGIALNQSSGSMEYDDQISPYDLREENSATIFAGYNWQNGGLVYGAELATHNGLTGPVGFSSEMDEYINDLRGRAGYVLGDFMVYGLAGYSYGSYMEASSWDISGYVYGVGAEYRIDGALIGVEYYEHHLEGSTTNPGQTHIYEPNTVAVRIGFSF